MQLTFVALAVLIAVATAMPRDLFEKFVHDYNMHYATPEEEAYRFKVFQQTLKRIEQFNKAEGAQVHGINQFADMTQDEFRGQYLMPKQALEQVHARMTFAPLLDLPAVSDIPTYFNWADNSSVITPVKNQGQCGSCWAFSVTENIESVWALAGNPIVSLAPQQIVDCDTTDAGCNGGNPPTAYEYVIKAGGLELETSYPYVAKDTKCTSSPSKFVAHITGYSWATKTKNETEMLVAAYTVAPLSICVDAITWQTYTSGIITKNCATSLDHCVQITGWNTANNVEYWIIRNSWGAAWGNKGFIYVERNKDLCGIGQEATTAKV